MDDGVTISIDPGLRFTAYSVFDSGGKILESKTIKFNTKLSQEKRLYDFYSCLTEVSSRYNVESVVTEYQFVNIMSNIVGMIMAFAGSIDNVKFSKFTPSQWKKAAFSKGNIDENILKDKIVEIYPEARDFDEHQLDTVGIYQAYIKIQKESKDDIFKKPKRVKRDKKSSKN